MLCQFKSVCLQHLSIYQCLPTIACRVHVLHLKYSLISSDRKRLVGLHATCHEVHNGVSMIFDNTFSHPTSSSRMISKWTWFKIHTVHIYIYIYIKDYKSCLSIVLIYISKHPTSTAKIIRLQEPKKNIGLISLDLSSSSRRLSDLQGWLRRFIQAAGGV